MWLTCYEGCDFYRFIT